MGICSNCGITVTDAIRVGESWVTDREAHDEKRIELFTDFYTRSMTVALKSYLTDFLFNMDISPDVKECLTTERLAQCVANFAEASVTEFLKYEDKITGLAVLAEADLGDE